MAGLLMNDSIVDVQNDLINQLIKEMNEARDLIIQNVMNVFGIQVTDTNIKDRLRIEQVEDYYIEDGLYSKKIYNVTIYVDGTAVYNYIDLGTSIKDGHWLINKESE